ncbi:hypothetical protein TEA_012476 [Camellia sinensis var. sinensis]|uniref:Uncharacterized protein n=1 Tax=Camellia sinensis var. sinensis TaxID=542762 RepID=A0A4S4EPV0_CAMSN|nr:hypothetical protein TEA_012476 [Camellia sinensis var. sinensis]
MTFSKPPYLVDTSMEWHPTNPHVSSISVIHLGIAISKFDFEHNSVIYLCGFGTLRLLRSEFLYRLSMSSSSSSSSSESEQSSSSSSSSDEAQATLKMRVIPDPSASWHPPGSLPTTSHSSSTSHGSVSAGDALASISSIALTIRAQKHHLYKRV